MSLLWFTPFLSLIIRLQHFGIFLFLSCSSFVVFHAVHANEPVNIGSRLEPMVDHALIDSLQGSLQLKLHHPTPQEVAITFEQPWEGEASGYPTVFKDGDIYRMYYRGHRYILDDPPIRDAQAEVTCYAESDDGIHWTKPNLGIYEWPGVEGNNIIWKGTHATHNFAPFKDTNPVCLPEQRYKAIGGTSHTDFKGLMTYQSADGIHWKPLSIEPVVTQGWFDSLNTVFWDPQHQRYSMFVRYYSEDKNVGLRRIGTCYSQDFETWTSPVEIVYPNSHSQQMYTNQILPYYRAPHVLFGFPARYVVRPLSKHVRQLPPVELRTLLIDLDQRCGTDLSDGLFMSSRDGISFKRWDEAFLRPGPESENRWVYGDNFQSYGLFEAKSSGPIQRISMLFDEGTWREGHRQLRRYTIRLDGFVSLNALYAGGQMTTQPLIFSGSRLTVNYATSAAGGLKVELVHADGSPIPGFTFEDSEELFGDSTAQAVSWKNGSDVSRLAGNPIRLHIKLKDGDLYAFQFSDPAAPDTP